MRVRSFAVRHVCALAAVPLVVIPAPVFAQSAPIASVSVTASPSTYKGPCPVVVTFIATVETTAETVLANFWWTRSDGSISTLGPEDITFARGPTELSTTWSFGLAGATALVEAAGWQALEIDILADGTHLRSDPASFEIACALGL